MAPGVARPAREGTPGGKPPSPLEGRAEEDEEDEDEGTTGVNAFAAIAALAACKRSIRVRLELSGGRLASPAGFRLLPS